MAKAKKKAMTLQELYEAYRVRKLLGASRSTFGKYRHSIAIIERLVGRVPTVDDLSDDIVSRLMAAKLDEGKTPHTANVFRAKICALWSWGAKRGFVKTWPDIDALNEPESVPTAWTAEQLSKVFQACELANRDMYGVPGSLWYRALLSVLWDTGERIGAILKADWARLSGEWLTIPASSRKGKTRDKVYRLHPDTVALLHKMRTYHQRDELFPYDCCRLSVSNRWRTMLNKSGLPSDSKHMFHCIRRSVASHAAQAGGDATAILDHSDSKLTKKHYLDPRVYRVSAPVDVLFRPEAPEVGDVGEGVRFEPEELRRLHELFASKVGDMLGVPESLWWSTYALFTRDAVDYPAGVKALPWAAFDLTRQEFDTRPFVCNVIRPFVSKLSDETVRLLGRYPVPRNDGPFAVKGKTIVQPDQRFKTLLRAAGVPDSRQAAPFIVYRRSVMAHATGPQGDWLMEPVLKFAE
jgi:integrase